MAHSWSPTIPKYGYHRLIPVKTCETNKELNITINKTYKRIRPFDHYVVVCDHFQCNQKWSDRKTFTSYSKYHQNKHHKDQPIQVRIVSYLTSNKHTKSFTQEYRLVNKATLNYVHVQGTFQRSQQINDSFVSNHILSYLSFPNSTAPLMLTKKPYIPIMFVKHLIDWGYSLQSNTKINQIIPISSKPIYDKQLATLRFNQFIENEWDPFDFQPMQIVNVHGMYF